MSVHFRGKSTSVDLPLSVFDALNQAFNKVPGRDTVSTAAMVYEDDIDWISEWNMTISMSNIVLDEAPSPPKSPTVTEFINANTLTSALVKIDLISQEVFGTEEEKPELSVADDEVLGGNHLVVEVCIAGMGFEAYRTLRPEFDRRMRSEVDEPDLRSMVVLTRFNG